MRRLILLVLVFLLLPSITSAAIALDTSANDLLSASPRSFSYSNSGNFVIVKTAGNTNYASTVTVNGVSATRAADFTPAPGDYLASVWYVASPGTGSITITVTGTGSFATQVSSYTGANGGFDAVGTAATGNSTSASASVTVGGSDCWVVTNTEFENNPTGGGTNNTQRQSSGNHYLGDSNGVVGPGSVSTVTAGNSGPWATVALSFCATAAATNKPFYTAAPWWFLFW